MQLAGATPQRHIVVFDCNVYLDVACLVGAPFTWDNFDSAVATLSGSSAIDCAPQGPPDSRVYPDSVRSLAVCTSGNFAGVETLHVAVNDSIQLLVHNKAMHALNWSKSDADTLLTEMIAGLVDRSDGIVVEGPHYPDSNPPLDHEDGMVFGACRFLASQDPLSRVYCVTRDKGFIDFHRNGLLGNHTTVLSPTKFVSLVRAARNPASIMAPQHR